MLEAPRRVTPARALISHKGSNPHVMIVGDVAHSTDLNLGLAFSGKKGNILKEWLYWNDIPLNTVHFSAVLLTPPSCDNLDFYLMKKTEIKQLGAPYSAPPVQTARYLDPHWLFEVARLKDEIEQVRPNIVVGLGSIAAWALTGEYKLKKWRGVTLESTLVPGQKCLLTYTPDQVNAQYNLRPVVKLDFAKVARECHTPEISRPKKVIFVPETLEEFQALYNRHLAQATYLSIDIETAMKQVTCIGFSPNRNLAVVVPFFDKTRPGASYWPSVSEEVSAWNLVARICASPAKKVFQNGAYDVQYLWRVHKIPVMNWRHDTMILHHSLQPEMDKSLGFLASLHLDLPEWKSMRTKTDTEKLGE